MYKDNFEVKFHYGRECLTKIIEGIVEIKLHEYHVQSDITQNEVKFSASLSELKEDGDEHEKDMEGCYICKGVNR